MIEDYNDGYAVTAPPAKFKPNRLGLYDMGGNVAEWCHDYYSIYTYAPERTYKDPAGPGKGKHHVIRGSSWKNGSISTLRLAYRSYDDDKREGDEQYPPGEGRPRLSNTECNAEVLSVDERDELTNNRDGIPRRSVRTD